MRLSVLTRRYAEALFRAALAADPDTGSVVDMVESDLGLITYSLHNLPKLRDVLVQPLIPFERKREIVRKVFGGRVQDMTLRFLELVLKKRRENVLFGLESEYIKLAAEHRGIVSVTVISAIPITEGERSALESKLATLTGKKVDMRLEEDPSLIGGVLLRIGDKVIDGSIRGYLASLRSRLLGGEEQGSKG